MEVAKCGKPISHKASPRPASDAYLDLRISKLRHRNHALARRTNIFNLATRICDSMAPFRMESYTLRETLEMSLDGRLLLHHDLATDIVQLCDLIEHPSHVAEAAITTTIAETARPKTTRTDSYLYGHSVGRSRPRRREDNSNGRGPPNEPLSESSPVGPTHLLHNPFVTLQSAPIPRLT